MIVEAWLVVRDPGPNEPDRLLHVPQVTQLSVEREAERDWSGPDLYAVYTPSSLFTLTLETHQVVQTDLPPGWTPPGAPRTGPDEQENQDEQHQPDRTGRSELPSLAVDECWDIQP